MSAQPSPPFARRQLGRLLRELRIRARITTEVACERLEMSSSRLSRIEIGQSAPDIHAARSMLDLYEIPGNEWEDILDLVRQAKQRAWWQILGYPALGYTGAEDAASAVQDFSIALIPGLLQTEAYMRAIFATAPLRRATEQIEKDVVARLRRQQRLVHNNQPLDLIAVIDEGAFHRPVGGVKVMRAQLRHIVDMSVLPNVSVHVVPTAVGAYYGMISSMTILSFTEPDDPSMVYVEHVLGSLRLEKADDVRRATLMFDQLRASALSHQESVHFIESTATEP